MCLYIQTLAKFYIMTKSISDYSVEDFLMDEGFIDWVYGDDKKTHQNWEGLIKDFPDCTHKIHQAKQILLSMDFETKKMSTNQKNELSERIQRKLQNDSADHVVVKKPGSNWMRYAALLALLIAVGIVVKWGIREKEQDVQVSQYVVKESAIGQKSTITLPDGSTVKLNSESKLVYGENFDEHLREVELTGEAFFMVVKKPSVPFIVKTGDIKATVLGTSFNVRNYEEDANIEIALATGSLQVEESRAASGNNKIVLAPSEMTNYSKSSGKMNKIKFEEEEVLAWKNNTLFFNQAEMKEIEQELERWFGVDIRVLNQPGTPVKLSTKFTNQSLENILETLGFTLGFQYEFSKNKVNVTFN